MFVTGQLEMNTELPPSCELRDEFVALGVRILPIHEMAARNYTACNRYFPLISGPIFPNRVFLPTAQGERES